jgi:hypothetical protein
MVPGPGLARPGLAQTQIWPGFTFASAPSGPGLGWGGKPRLTQKACIGPNGPCNFAVVPTQACKGTSTMESLLCTEVQNIVTRS